VLRRRNGSKMGRQASPAPLYSEQSRRNYHAHDMGSFRVDVELENPARPGQRRTVRSVLVDTGAELSWVPGQVLESLGVEHNNRWLFRQADGTILERWTGSVLLRRRRARGG